MATYRMFGERQRGQVQSAQRLLAVLIACIVVAAISAKFNDVPMFSWLETLTWSGIGICVLFLFIQFLAWRKTRAGTPDYVVTVTVEGVRRQPPDKNDLFLRRDELAGVSEGPDGALWLTTVDPVRWLRVKPALERFDEFRHEVFGLGVSNVAFAVPDGLRAKRASLRRMLWIVAVAFAAGFLALNYVSDPKLETLCIVAAGILTVGASLRFTKDVDIIKVTVSFLAVFLEPLLRAWNVHGWIAIVVCALPLLLVYLPNPRTKNTEPQTG